MGCLEVSLIVKTQRNAMGPRFALELYDDMIQRNHML